MAYNYKNTKLRLTSAFVASFYMMFHGRAIEFIRAFSSPKFYLAFAVSFGIGILLVWVVHLITLRLDVKCPWRERPFERGVMQFFFGVLLPACLDLLLISEFYEATNQSFKNTNFLIIDFPIVVFFLIMLNLYYLIHYLILTIMEIELSHKTSVTKEIKSVIQFVYRGTILNFRADDVLYFYRFGKKVTLVSTDKREYPLNFTISGIYEEFKNSGFIQINRSVLINIKILRGFEAGTRKNTLQLIFKPEHEALIPNWKSDQFQVTKEYITSFKSQLQAESGISQDH